MQRILLLIFVVASLLLYEVLAYQIIALQNQAAMLQNRLQIVEEAFKLPL